MKVLRSLALVALASVVVGCSGGGNASAPSVRTTSTDPSQAAIDRANDDFMGCVDLLSDWKDFKTAHLDGLVAGLSTMSQSDWAGLGQAFTVERGKVAAQVETMHNATAVAAWSAYGSHDA